MVFRWRMASCFLAFTFLALLPNAGRGAGSASVLVSQRFFSDSRLADQNGFSKWGRFQFEGQFSFFDLPYLIEPLVGFGFVQGSADAYVVDVQGNRVASADGQYIVSTVDELRYRLLMASTGLRMKAWPSRFFPMVPYFQVMQSFRWGQLEKKTYALSQVDSITGFDIGSDLGGGVLVSFLERGPVRGDLETDWGIHDFGLLLFARYFFGGQWRQGLGEIESLGGWDFGAGLHLVW